MRMQTCRSLESWHVVLRSWSRIHIGITTLKRLSGELKGRFRYRIGDWRVVYRVEEEDQRVIVLLIAHRRDVYE